MPTRVLTSVLVLPLLAAARVSAQEAADTWLAECRGRHWSDRPHACEVRETGMRATRGTFTADPGQNGGVAIYGWDRDSVAVVAKIQAHARTEEDARQILRAVRIAAAGRTVKAEGPAQRSREHWAVSFDIYVPRRTDLSLETVNGPLSVEAVSGTMDLHAVNGPVSLSGVGGAVTARVQNGPLSVHLQGERWDGTGLDAETVNGPVSLAIPARYNAQLETGTVNGPMDLSFPLTVTIEGRVSHRIRSRLGDGGAPVRVVTTNGPLSIRRAR